MRIVILSKEKVLYDGYVKTVTSHNDVGTFDILENHANFITMLKDEVLLDKGTQKEKRFDVKEGVLSVADDRVEIFL